jgi:RNA polymerase sigma-70 factor (ECF subfamily)
VPSGVGTPNVRLVVTPELSDAQLFAAYVAGDSRAFAQLYRRHADRLTRFAAARCDNPDDAAEVLQEAMVSVHRRAAGFRHQCAVTSWLYRVVANACVDRHRRNAARPRVGRTCGVEPWQHAVDLRDRLDTVIAVRAAVAQLPRPQREAVLAVDIAGHSVADAALLLGVPEGTVKSRRARARATLSGLLGPPARGAGPAGGH